MGNLEQVQIFIVGVFGETGIMKEILEIMSNVCSIAAFIVSLFTATSVHKISQKVVDKSRKKGNTNIAIGFRGNDFVGGNKESGKS